MFTESLLIPAFNASTWTGPTGNNTYLLLGSVPTLIDAGVGRPEHLDAVERALRGRALEVVLVTHSHVDHISGAAAIAERWSAVRVRQLGAGAHPIAPGERIPAGDMTLRAVETPGHAPDHLCFYVEETRDLFCGDLARHGGTVVIPAGRGGDLVQYLESLRRIRSLKPSRLLPGHGPIVTEPERLIDEYLAHRAERDRQILAVLERRPAPVDEIAASIYPALPDSLREASERTVLAHLIKLAAEGRVRDRDGVWSQAG